MRKISILSVLVVLLLTASCQSVTREAPTPIPATTPEPRDETSPGKELTVEAWEIADNWTYSQQAIWEDVMVGLESERERGKIVKQFIATYNLHSREKELVYELPVAGQTPAIHGSRVVWASSGDVFLLDLKTREVQQITNDEYTQAHPVIYGDTIVWLDSRYEAPDDHRPRPFDVYAYDLKTKSEKRLTSATTAEGHNRPSISGNLVVWADNRHAKPERSTHPPSAPEYNNDIYLYDLTAGQEKRITSYSGNDRHPDIDGDKIVWLRQEDYIRADVFVYNLETGRESQVSKSRFADFQPSIHQDCIVWVDARVSLGNTASDTVIKGRQGQTNIHLYDLETQQEMQLTSTKPGEVLLNPLIFGDLVVYERISMLERVAYAVDLTQ
jgi:beta propeller repeat protein